MVGFGIRNNFFSEDNKRFTLFAVPLAQETHSKGGVVTPKSNILNRNRCVCTHLPPHQMPQMSWLHFRAESSQDAKKDPGWLLCVRKASRIRQSQLNRERLISFTEQALSLWYENKSKDIKNRNALKMMKEYHIKKKKRENVVRQGPHQ